MGKISYERGIYESVDDQSLSWDISQKSTENKIHAAKVNPLWTKLFLSSFFGT